jgi:hypothetical protein
VGGDLLIPADLSRLPWPDEWPAPRRVRILAVLFVGMLTIGGLAMAMTGDPDAIGLAFLSTPALGALTVLLADALRTRRPSLRRVRVAPLHDAVVGTVIPQRRLREMCMLPTFLFGLAAGLTGLVGGLARDELALALASPLWLLLFGWAVVDTVDRLRHPARIVLTPDAIAVEEKGRRTLVRWGDVLCFWLGSDRHPRISVFVPIPEESRGWRPRWWAPSRRSPGSPISLEAERYAIDPVALLATLEFYLAYPTLRGELADGQVLERLRRGDITRDANATVSGR